MRKALTSQPTFWKIVDMIRPSRLHTVVSKTQAAKRDLTESRPLGPKRLAVEQRGPGSSIVIRYTTPVIRFTKPPTSELARSTSSLNLHSLFNPTGAQAEIEFRSKCDATASAWMLTRSDDSSNPPVAEVRPTPF